MVMFDGVYLENVKGMLTQIWDIAWCEQEHLQTGS